MLIPAQVHKKVKLWSVEMIFNEKNCRQAKISHQRNRAQNVDPIRQITKIREYTK
jgi:hypothetical protein